LRGVTAAADRTEIKNIDGAAAAAPPFRWHLMAARRLTWMSLGGPMNRN